MQAPLGIRLGLVQVHAIHYATRPSIIPILRPILLGWEALGEPTRSFRERHGFPATLAWVRGPGSSGQVLTQILWCSIGYEM